MDPTIEVDEKIDIIAVYKCRGKDPIRCVPSKMRWRGRDISLTELALRHPTVAGKRMIHVFHASDGVNGYRLEFDAEGLSWRLVSIISGEDHA